MEGLLRQRQHEGRLSGILNGVDAGIWNPESDLLLASRYDRDRLEDKAENKRQLQIAMGLKVDDKAPLFAVVSRLTSQKGLDLVLEALPGLLEQGGQLALLGAGTRYSGKVSSLRPPSIRAKSACRLVITRPSHTASWGAPT